MFVDIQNEVDQKRDDFHKHLPLIDRMLMLPCSLQMPCRS
jgi:hypothetical protein